MISHKVYKKTQNTLSFPAKMISEWLQTLGFCFSHRRCKGDGELPRADRADGGAAEQGEQILRTTAVMIHDDPWWSVSICFQFLFPVSVSFLFPSVSRLKLSTRRRDDKGCFPRYFGLVLSALSCLSPSKKKHVRKAVYHKNVKRMQTMVHSTLIAKHLVVAPGAYILSENAKLHFQDQHRYLEISWNDGWTIVIFQILFTQSVYLYLYYMYL